MDIKVGDLVTAYWSGYFEVVKIMRRWEDKTKATEYYRTAYNIQGIENYNEDICGEEMQPLIVMLKRFDKSGKKVVSRKEQTCDATYCKDAEEILPLEIEKLKQSINLLNDVYKFKSST